MNAERWKLGIEGLRKRTASSEDPEALIRQIREIETELPEVPAIPRLLAEDVTPERVASLMQEQGGRLAVFSDEGGIFDILAGRYSNGIPNLDVFLKGHSVSPLRVDRQDPNRAPIIIDRPYLTVGILPQLDVLAMLRNTPGFRGRGLLARFLYALPQSRLGSRTLVPRPVPADIEDRYKRGIRDLLRYRPEEVFSLWLAPAAYLRWKEFQRGVERQFLPGGDLELIQDWGGKLPGAVLRLMGIFHMVEQIGRSGMETEVPLTITAPAIEMGTRLISHTRAAFDIMDSDPEIEQAEKVIAWFVEAGRINVQRAGLPPLSPDTLQTCLCTSDNLVTC
ncbi:MAG: DUF3987 domain-containing protein [Acidobacteriia bacterium]|nr:DUF3987 domain-containing protein [Terriglobia bacterium]